MALKKSKLRLNCDCALTRLREEHHVMLHDGSSRCDCIVLSGTYHDGGRRQQDQRTAQPSSQSPLGLPLGQDPIFTAFEHPDRDKSLSGKAIAVCALSTAREWWTRRHSCQGWYFAGNIYPGTSVNKPAKVPELL
jgi:hypothetical protein